MRVRARGDGDAEPGDEGGMRETETERKRKSGERRGELTSHSNNTHIAPSSPYFLLLLFEVGPPVDVLQRVREGTPPTVYMVYIRLHNINGLLGGSIICIHRATPKHKVCVVCRLFSLSSCSPACQGNGGDEVDGEGVVLARGEDGEG